jgi:hypothetical protein
LYRGPPCLWCFWNSWYVHPWFTLCLCKSSFVFCQVQLLLSREFFLVVVILFLFVVQVFNQRQSVY